MLRSDRLHHRTIRVRLDDLPGSLHGLTGLVAAAGVNIVRLEVVSRESPEVWDDIELAAANEEQIDVVVTSLRERGLDVIGLPAAWAIRDWAVDVLHALERLGEAEHPDVAVDRFARTAATLANAEHAFVLMEPAGPDAVAAEARWGLIQEAVSSFDPDSIRWSGDSVGVRIVRSAMYAARAEAAVLGDREGVGALIWIPIAARRPAHLVVVGHRPPFLAPELARLDLFAQVAGPHLSVVRVAASA